MSLTSGCQQKTASNGAAPNFFQFDPSAQWNGTWNASDNGLWSQMHIHFFTHEGQTYGSMRVAKDLEIRHINLVDIAPGFGSITFATDWDRPAGIGGLAEAAIDLAVDELFAEDVRREMMLSMNDSGTAQLHVLKADGQWQRVTDATFSK
jgi:hypothetical protein